MTDDGSNSRLADALREWAPPPAPPGLVDRIVAAVDAAPPPRRARGWRAAAAAGAAVAAAIAVALAIFGPWRPRAVAEGRLVGGAAAERAIGARARVVADAGAALEWRAAAGLDGAVVVTHTRGRARYVVEPGGPFEVRTPAGTARVTGTELVVAVEEESMTSTGKAAVGALSVVVVTVAVVTGSVLFENDHGALALAAGEIASARAGEAPARRGAGAAAAESPAPRRAAPAVRRFGSPEARAALLRAIAATRARRLDHAPSAGAPAAAPADVPADGTPAGTLNREYIRSVVGDAVPLVRECYEMSLETSPDLAGRLVMHFTIAGEADVGGIVEEATVEPDEALAGHADFAECMRETILSLEFPAPEGGGVVNVSYPFIFNTEPDEADAGGAAP
jgi:hypothetical protein